MELDVGSPLPVRALSDEDVASTAANEVPARTGVDAASQPQRPGQTPIVEAAARSGGVWRMQEPAAEVR